jgi:hypothetical protein
VLLSEVEIDAEFEMRMWAPKQNHPQDPCAIFVHSIASKPSMMGSLA